MVYILEKKNKGYGGDLLGTQVDSRICPDLSMLIFLKNLWAKGQELALGIRADAEKQREVILAEAYSEAEKTRGEGDALAASIYASAFQKDEKFYEFYRSMTAYRNTFSSKGDVLLIQPDSDFFKYMNSNSLK